MLWRFEEYELDEARYEMRRAGEPVALEPQVFELLRYLVQHHDRVVTRDEVIDHIWPERYITDAALNSRLMAARKAIGDSGREQRLIRTVHGRGFRFCGDVESVTHVPTVRAVEREPPGGNAPLRQDIRFCQGRDGVTLAYAISGSGPPLVKAPNWMTHLEYDLESPIWGHLVREIASRRTLIRMDQRGCGLSDWDVEDNGLERWVDDLEAVVEAADPPVPFPLLGISQGGPIAVTFARRHPEMISHLVLLGAYTRGWQQREQWVEERRAMKELMRTSWGREDAAFRHGFSARFVPKMPPEAVTWLTDLQRVSTSAENASRVQELTGGIDVTDLLPKLDLPVLVMHALRDHVVPFDEGRRLAARIPGARFVPLDSDNHLTLESEPAWHELRAELWSFLGEWNLDASPGDMARVQSSG